MDLMLIKSNKAMLVILRESHSITYAVDYK